MRSALRPRSTSSSVAATTVTATPLVSGFVQCVLTRSGSALVSGDKPNFRRRSRNASARVPPLAVARPTSAGRPSTTYKRSISLLNSRSPTATPRVAAPTRRMRRRSGGSGRAGSRSSSARPAAARVSRTRVNSVVEIWSADWSQIVDQRRLPSSSRSTVRSRPCRSGMTSVEVPSTPTWNSFSPLLSTIAPGPSRGRAPSEISIVEPSGRFTGSVCGGVAAVDRLSTGGRRHRRHDSGVPAELAPL